MLWPAELERGSVPILSTKNQLWSLTYLFEGKLRLAKHKDGEGIQFHWPLPWAGTALLIQKKLLQFFFSVLTSANILVAVVLCTDSN